MSQNYKGERVSSVGLMVDDTTLKKFEEKITKFLKKSYAKSVKGII